MGFGDRDHSVDLPLFARVSPRGGLGRAGFSLPKSSLNVNWFPTHELFFILVSLNDYCNICSILRRRLKSVLVMSEVMVVLRLNADDF